MRIAPIVLLRSARRPGRPDVGPAFHARPRRDRWRRFAPSSPASAPSPPPPSWSSTGGWRGIPASTPRIARVAAILDSAGFVLQERAPASARLTYRIEHRPMSRPTWEPVDGSLTIVGQPVPILRYATNRHMLGMYSVSTPAGGVEAELVDVGKGSAGGFFGKGRRRPDRARRRATAAASGPRRFGSAARWACWPIRCRPTPGPR